LQRYMEKGCFPSVRSRSVARDAREARFGSRARAETTARRS
jgi:hypothetical protein